MLKESGGHREAEGGALTVQLPEEHAVLVWQPIVQGVPGRALVVGLHDGAGGRHVAQPQSVAELVHRHREQVHALGVWGRGSSARVRSILLHRAYEGPHGTHRWQGWPPLWGWGLLGATTQNTVPATRGCRGRAAGSGVRGYRGPEDHGWETRMGSLGPASSPSSPPPQPFQPSPMAPAPRRSRRPMPSPPIPSALPLAHRRSGRSRPPRHQSGCRQQRGPRVGRRGPGRPPGHRRGRRHCGRPGRSPLGCRPCCPPPRGSPAAPRHSRP